MSEGCCETVSIPLNKFKALEQKREALEKIIDDSKVTIWKYDTDPYIVGKYSGVSYFGNTEQLEEEFIKYNEEMKEKFRSECHKNHKLQRDIERLETKHSTLKYWTVGVSILCGLSLGTIFSFLIFG